MTELTLNCSTCTTLKKDCPYWRGKAVENIHNIPNTHPLVEIVETIGCMYHNRALQVLAAPVIEELEKWRSNLDKHHDIAPTIDQEQTKYGRNILGKVIALIKGGA